MDEVDEREALAGDEDRPAAPRAGRRRSGRGTPAGSSDRACGPPAAPSPAGPTRRAHRAGTARSGPCRRRRPCADRRRRRRGCGTTRAIGWTKLRRYTADELVNTKCSHATAEQLDHRSQVGDVVGGVVIDDVELVAVWRQRLGQGAGNATVGMDAPDLGRDRRLVAVDDGDVVAPADELGQQVQTDVAVAAGDQSPHAVCLPRRRRAGGTGRITTCRCRSQHRRCAGLLRLALASEAAEGCCQQSAQQRGEADQDEPRLGSASRAAGRVDATSGDHVPAGPRAGDEEDQADRQQHPADSPPAARGRRGSPHTSRASTGGA